MIDLIKMSEPETQTVVWLVDTYSRIRWYVDVHSAVPVILHNWEAIRTRPPNQRRRFSIAHSMACEAARTTRPTASTCREQVSISSEEALGICMNDAVKAVRGDNYGVEQATVSIRPPVRATTMPSAAILPTR